MSAIEVRNLSKNYPLSGSQTARLWRVFKPGAEIRDGLWALRDVSFTVERGEAFGIVGANGSGKSTLLQIIAGILRPSSGSVELRGRLSALLELGSGFSPEFTGRDNVYLNGSILGLSRGEIDDRFEAIERFAEIGDFIDQPIRTYSTGMVLRLAFAVAANVDPEILIVDEALAVGDIAFRQRCMHRIHDLRARGTTILFVSHETSDVKALCERCLWLQNGTVRQLGEADEVVTGYLRATLQRERSSPPPENAPPEIVMGFDGDHRYGDGRATIIGADLTSATASVRTLSVRTELQQILEPHDRVTLRFSFRINALIPSPIAGFLIRNGKGEFIFGSNTVRENYPVPHMVPGSVHTVVFHWAAPELLPGRYAISFGLADGTDEHFQMCDYAEDAIQFTQLPDPADPSPCHRGYFRLRCAAVAIHRQ